MPWLSGSRMIHRGLPCPISLARFTGRQWGRSGWNPAPAFLTHPSPLRFHPRPATPLQPAGQWAWNAEAAKNRAAPSPPLAWRRLNKKQEHKQQLPLLSPGCTSGRALSAWQIQPCSSLPSALERSALRKLSLREVRLVSHTHLCHLQGLHSSPVLCPTRLRAPF